MFKNAKVGDRVWDFVLGWGVIVSTDFLKPYPVEVNFETNKTDTYTYDGKKKTTDIKPSLYWDEIKFEIPKKPFDLKAEFDKLDAKRFEYTHTKYLLVFNEYCKEWEDIYIDSLVPCYHPTSIYFGEENFIDFIEQLNKYKITPEQLRPLMLEKLKEVYGE